MPMSAVLTLISHDLILLLLGPQWQKAGQIFLCFGFSIGIMIIYLTHGWLHLSLGTPDRWFRWSIIEFIVTSLCFLVGLAFGPLGIAVAFSASFYILLCPALWYAGKPIQLKISYVLSVLWKYYVSALTAGLFCWFILYSYSPTSTMMLKYNVLIRVVISIISSLLLYLALVIAFHQSIKPVSQFLLILREITKKKSPEQEHL
jgi:PST family polysaccharide transporter